MPRIDITEVERLALAKAGAQSTPCTHGWRPIETAPKNKLVLVSFNWKKNQEFYDPQEEWSIDVGRYNGGRYIDGCYVDLEEMDAVWQPLPKPPQE